MGKSKKNQNKDREANKSSSASSSSKTVMKKRKRREVQIVKCSADFPVSSKPPPRSTEKKTASTTKPKEEAGHHHPQRPSSYHHQGEESNSDVLPLLTHKNLDWHDTAHEIRSLGATAFVGQQKRNYQDEQYEKLTGRKQKKQHVPFPIQMGIRKKAAQRLERQLAEAKASGLVLPKSMTSKTNAKKKRDERSRTSRIHGPAPSVGFMSKGVLRVKKSSR